MTRGVHRPPAVLILVVVAVCLQINALADPLLPELVNAAKDRFVGDYRLQILAVFLLLGAGLAFYKWRAGQFDSRAREFEAKIKRLYREVDDLKQELEYRAGHDPLTRLPNRGAALAYLTSELEKQSEGALGCIIVALDNFKRANDSLGQAKGDEILCIMAAKIREAVRDGDMVARYGGDEFLVVLPAASNPDLETVARRVAALSHTQESTPGWKITVTTSVGGILAVKEAGLDERTVLATADALLYEVKRQGGRGYRLEQVGQNATAAAGLTTES